jgi:hypothetical protein
VDAVTETAAVRNETLVSTTLSADQSFSSGQLARVAFDTEVKDERGEFDITTHELTVDKTGFYHVNVGVKADVNSGDNILVQLYDGSDALIDLRKKSNASASVSFTASKLAKLDAGTNYYVRFRNNTSSATVKLNSYLTVRSALRFL